MKDEVVDKGEKMGVFAAVKTAGRTCSEMGQSQVKRLVL
jgi:ribosomal protein S19E (S16A)